MIKPRALSRAAGTLYLIIIVIGLFEEILVRGRLIVPGDAAATAANLRSTEWLWRAGVASEFALLICAVVLTAIFFVMFRPVSRDLTLLAVFFNLVTIAVEATAGVSLAAALLPLTDASSLRAFQPDQLYALAGLAVRSHSYGFGAALIFFGCECLVLGYLIFRSGFLPRALGVLMQIAGASYLINCFAMLLSPRIAALLFPAILLPAFVGEASFCLWLLVKGIDAEKWTDRQSRVRMNNGGATDEAHERREIDAAYD